MERCGDIIMVNIPEWFLLIPVVRADINLSLPCEGYKMAS